MDNFTPRDHEDAPRGVRHFAPPPEWPPVWGPPNPYVSMYPPTAPNIEAEELSRCIDPRLLQISPSCQVDQSGSIHDTVMSESESDETIFRAFPMPPIAELRAERVYNLQCMRLGGVTVASTPARSATANCQSSAGAATAVQSNRPRARGRKGTPPQPIQLNFECIVEDLAVRDPMVQPKPYWEGNLLKKAARTGGVAIELFVEKRRKRRRAPKRIGRPDKRRRC
ncbi:hypothetical protein FN846DRAFT_890800 [Sphaerosporella brunnea]|uniref:Uncharacterized protein n=1 Tax=Sphaerosporella brunnea TaxID=1250544 RepID=A0A5J5EVD8_9PEZI|nr:hypothetical protein FN846DRAFT_890800 [Sphaerosporella brunnea]